ncbi:MAG: leucine-rich repeat domain-containing protein [Clostridia bacterium]|nr:leucine-rich repeat domain-containing protein [Clostridia bacterium]
MKKIIKLIAVSLLLIVSVVCFVACGDNGSNSSKDVWEYKVYSGDDFATVIRYNGSDKSVEIPSEFNGNVVKRIKKGAFSGNATIETLIVPSSVEEIDGGAFEKMKALSTVSLPFIGRFKTADDELNTNNVKTEKKAVGAERTFGFLFGEDEYECGTQVCNPYNADGSADKDYYLPVSLTTVIINPSEEYGVPACAFYENSLIKTVVLGDKVKAIGEYAFANCTSLHTIDLNKVETVKANAFKDDTALNSFNETTGKGVKFSEITTIGEYAFSNTGFYSLTIVKSVITIGDYAFSNCATLNNVVIEKEGDENYLEIGKGAFYNCDNLKNFDSQDNIVADAKANFSKVKSIGVCAFDGIDDVEFSVFNYGGFDLASIFGSTNVDA